jgi:hypothetical protein
MWRSPTPVHELRRAYVVHFRRAVFGHPGLWDQVQERVHALDACHAATYFKLGTGTDVYVTVEVTNERVKLHRVDPGAPWLLVEG